ncbi:MAG TPA: DUF2795 domain-containing protein [Acidimicrobiales bacterium]|nr:DUF2795 domain-containing protein [Acidimicrobiales bacterium]
MPGSLRSASSTSRRLPAARRPPPAARRRPGLAAVLRPSAFPGTRERLLAAAGEEHAPPELLEALGALPGGVSFQRFEEAWEALGGGREGSHC